MDESKNVATPEAQRLDAAAACLASGEFDEAELFFKKLVDVDAYKCRAYLGLYCVKIKNKTLYVQLTGTYSAAECNISDAAAWSDLLEKALKYCDNASIAHNILKYIKSGLDPKLLALGPGAEFLGISVIDFCRLVTDADIDFKKFKSKEVDDLYLEIAVFQGTALLHFGEYDVAYRLFSSVLDECPGNVAVLQMRFYAKIGFSFDSADKADWKKFSKEEAADIVSASVPEKFDRRFFDNVCRACVRYIEKYGYDIAGCNAAFSAMLDIYAERDENAVGRKIDDYVSALLSRREFESAKSYLDRSVEQGNDSPKLRWLLLLVKLGVSEDEFVSCESFSKDMPEYEDLIISCGSDAAARKEYIAKADANYAYRERKKTEKNTQKIGLKQSVDQKQQEQGFVSLRDVPFTDEKKNTGSVSGSDNKKNFAKSTTERDKKSKGKFVALLLTTVGLMALGFVLALVIRNSWCIAPTIVAGVVCFYSIGVFAGDKEHPATELESKFCNVFMGLLFGCVALLVFGAVYSCGNCGGCGENPCDWSACDDPCSMIFDWCTGNN